MVVETYDLVVDGQRNKDKINFKIKRDIASESLRNKAWKMPQ